METVQVGQVWKDNDKRVEQYRGVRWVRVYEISDGFAFCHEVIPHPDDDTWMVRPKTRPTRISVKRMKPTSAGYVRVA